MCLVRTTKTVVKATKATTKKTTMRTTHKTTAKKEKTTKSHHVISAPTSFLDIMLDEKMFKGEPQFYVNNFPLKYCL